MTSTAATASKFDRVRITADAKAIVRLGTPILVNNLSVNAMSFADTVMAGQLGARDLAGLAVGVGYFNLFLFIGLGLFMSLSPAVAHAYGADDAPAVTKYVQQSWWLVILTTVLLFIGAWQAEWVLTAVGINPEALPIAIGYVEAMSWGMPGLFGFFALRFASEGLGHTRPIMYIAFSCLLLNVFGNWVFMYGKFGMPAMGAVGCGVATAISYWAMFAAMLVYMGRHRFYRRFQLFRGLQSPDWRIISELLRLGVPVACTVLAEGGLFAVAALMMGVMGSTIASAHQIALNYAAFMFMVPLAVSSATTIHVGHLRGSGALPAARHAAWTGIGICVAVMAVSASSIVLLNDQIAFLYTRDIAVRDLAASLLLLAAVFQISDGLQVGAAGALRGFKDTAVPMGMTLFAYWGVGFPLAYVLGVQRAMGPAFVWVGLIAGLTVSAVLLVTRLHFVSREQRQPPFS